ncbi:hypothetical protein KBC70_02785 [Candidatus Woesebacteria bacterium]|jgi:hypothetical protein|nr:hypothetical protein [Candidatus Woesebacteria bacterium]
MGLIMILGAVAGFIAGIKLSIWVELLIVVLGIFQAWLAFKGNSEFQIFLTHIVFPIFVVGMIAGDVYVYIMFPQALGGFSIRDGLKSLLTPPGIQTPTANPIATATAIP